MSTLTPSIAAGLAAELLGTSLAENFALNQLGLTGAGQAPLILPTEAQPLPEAKTDTEKGKRERLR